MRWGQVRKGESFETAVRRQMFEEFGLDVEVYQCLRPYEIHIPAGQGIIPGMRFLCRAHDGRIRLNKKEFSRCRWVSIDPVPALDWIGGVKEILDTITPELLPDMTGDVHASSTPEKRPAGFIAPSRKAEAS